MRLLLTGIPGIGKTTIIRDVVKRLEGLKCAGFFTEERRRGGQRIGFKITTLAGAEGTLASLGGKIGPRVGRYTVHVEEFERLILPLLDPKITPADLYVIDEIGKMELLSEKFTKRLIELLTLPTNILATIAKKGAGLAEEIKERSDVELIEVTRENRGQLPDRLARRILRGIGRS